MTRRLADEMLLIVLTGPDGSGKELAGEYLCDALEAHGYRCRRVRIRGPLREMSEIVAPALRLMTRREIDAGEPIPGMTMTWQQVLDELEACGRRIHPALWVRHVHERLRAWAVGHVHRRHLPLAAVVTDAERDSEVRWGRDEGGVVVRLVRHGSGTDVADALPADLVLDNTGTPADLRDRIERVLPVLLGRQAVPAPPADRRGPALSISSERRAPAPQ